jgi:hypothetical protein
LVVFDIFTFIRKINFLSKKRNQSCVENGNTCIYNLNIIFSELKIDYILYITVYFILNLLRYNAHLIFFENNLIEYSFGFSVYLN